MKSPGYQEKFDHAVDQKTRVDKTLSRKDIQNNLYIKNRLKALQKTKDFVSGKKD